MKHLAIIRSYLPSATIGFVDLPNKRLQTMELPWLDNKEDESCIPEGTYLVKRDKTGKHQFYAIQNVPERTNIEIHIANYLKDINGCTGMGLTRMDDGISVGNSAKALAILKDYLGDEDSLITYRQFNPHTDRW